MAPLTFAALHDWLVSLGVDDSTLNQGPFIPEMPNRLTTLTMLGGAGLTTEGALDNPQFQVRCRSEQGDQTSGESAANEIDQLIYGASFPVTVDGVNFITVYRLGGAPAPLGPPDDGQRFDYVCTYMATIGY